MQPDPTLPPELAGLGPGRGGCSQPSEVGPWRLAGLGRGRARLELPWLLPLLPSSAPPPFFPPSSPPSLSYISSSFFLSSSSLTSSSSSQGLSPCPSFSEGLIPGGAGALGGGAAAAGHGQQADPGQEGPSLGLGWGREGGRCSCPGAPTN